MPHGAEQLRVGLLDKAVDIVRDKLGANKAATAAAFVRRFYANVSPDDISRRTADDLAGAALAIWRFGSPRRPGHAKVRAYKPVRTKHGWASSHAVVEIVNDDMPFLVDSVTAALNLRDITVHLVIHPVMMVRRGKDGRFLGLVSEADEGEPPAGALAESFMQLEISEQPAHVYEEITAELEGVLADVRRVVEDFRPMRGRVDELLAELDAAPPPLSADEISEVKDFLEWLRDDHFTFLGMRSYDLVREDGDLYHRPIKETGLGLLRTVSAESAVRHATPLSPQVAEFAQRKELLMIAKAEGRSTVHRAVPMDFVGVRRFNEQGDVIGEHRLIGLFTSIAYNQRPRYIPVLRRKVERVVARAGFAPDSHDGKALPHILESYPRDELFQISEDELYDIALGILHLQERQRIALFVRTDPFSRHVSCLVFVPRDRYNSELRQRFQRILEEAFNGTVSNFQTQVGNEPLARVHFIVSTTPEDLPEFDVREIEARLTEAARSWRDRLQEALVAEKGEGVGLALLQRYADAFSRGYQERFSARDAVGDIQRVEKVCETGALGLYLYRNEGAAESEVRFKIYQPGDPVALSDVLPVLENMGFDVITEIPFSVTPEDADGTVWIQEFGMAAAAGGAVDLERVRGDFEECFARVWVGEVEDDGFNRLVVEAALTWREIVILRAYCKFLRQAAIPFSEAYMQRTLVCNPDITRLLVDLFIARFDNDRRKDADSQAQRLESRIEDGLENVANLDEDRILRRFLNLVKATLRTNYFRREKNGGLKPYLSMKFDSRAIDELPKPRPMYEIFVYSPRTEGVHLRGGKVARGGIRWSDRREDFRTEVLGLMKAQMVKNAVIVPVGSKGGFVVKRPPPAAEGREALSQEVVACYKTLIRGMLDLTDNLKGDVIVPPRDVVRYDDDDPYLVVAADKGTATFSDIANRVAAEYGFWLDDAFASGGSEGYDHKKMGITARGGWESVKRHFRELGVDIQRQDFTVVGVGDMSGDVFGNGMLLSKHIKLVGAFNHMHIFVDPDPDPRKSYQERRRLFRLARSTWADYKPELISEGGGVFDRKAKHIPVTPAMRKLFGVSGERITPNDLVQAMLGASVDLLWFGGIGTYVKAKAESDFAVGDRANDAVRIDAGSLRCRVIGEGANLGVTQRGRIEFALNGGRVNTDAIDNSAGVDCSDHEVNIKIPLRDLMVRKEMTRKDRNRLLDAMTDDVAALVLRDNYLQTQAISVTEALGAEVLDQHARLMRNLERGGRLDRALEFLPDEETLEERQASKRGLTRPELAVLLAYAKIWLYDELLPSDLPDDSLLAEDLHRYFPAALQEKCVQAIERHRLRREIVATSVTNSLVNRVGPSFVNEMKERTGMAADDIARAYAITRDIFDLRTLWGEIEALDNKAPANVQTDMMIEIGRLVERATLWFLRHCSQPLNVAGYCDEYGPGIMRLRDVLLDMVSAVDRESLQRRMDALTQQSVPEALARSVTSLDLLASALDIVRIALGGGLDVEKVGRIYFRIGARFGLDWLRAEAGGLTPADWWEKQAVNAVVDDLYAHQSEITTHVLEIGGGTDVAENVIDVWAEARAHSVERVDRLLADLRTAPQIDFAMLAVANRQIRSMIGT